MTRRVRTCRTEPVSTTADRLDPLTAARASHGSSSHVKVPAVLVVDDDVDVRQMIERALQPLGYEVRTASSGTQAIALATTNDFNLMLLDLRLPDMLGTQVVRAVHDAAVDVPFVLISGYLTVTATIDAMRLGAMDVIEKPVAIDDLVSLVSSAVSGHIQRRPPRPVVAMRSPPPQGGAVNPLRARPRSAAERWAMLVLKACEADGDPRTLEDWASGIGVSYTSLRESCRLLRIPPHDARDLLRVLRAVIKSELHGCPPAALLDVSDSRTLKHLLTRAGIRDEAHAEPVSLERFLDAQQFVDQQNQGMRVLRTLLLTTGSRR